MRRRGFFNTPEDVAKEIVFWIHKHPEFQELLDNTKENLAYQQARGMYDRRAAVRIFMTVVKEAVANYAEEMGGVRQQTFPQDVEYMAAELLCDEFEQTLETGEAEPEVAAEEPTAESITVPVESGQKQIVINLNIAARRAARQKREKAMRRIMARKKAQGSDESHQPGQVSGTLRRRMGDALADLFDQFGPDIYGEVILSMKEMLLEKFEDGFNGLNQVVKDELGNRGVKESREHIRAWSAEIVEDVNHYGLDEVAGALEDHVSSLTAEYIQADEGDEVLEVGEQDVDEVDVVEEEDVEPVAEDEASEEDVEEVPELDLEDVEVPEIELGARPGYRRQHVSPRRFTRTSRHR